MTISQILSKIIECDRAVKDELEKIGSAMYAVMVNDREFNKVWVQSGGLERFIWNLNHRLAWIVCRSFFRSKSALCRLCELHQRIEQSQSKIDNCIAVVHNRVAEMDAAVYSEELMRELSHENEIYISSFLRDCDLYLKQIRELDRYSSAVPRMIPDKKDMAEFMSLRRMIPSNCPAFRQFAARFAEEVKAMDAKLLKEAQEDAEHKKLRLQEDFACRKQQFENELNETALNAALNGVGIDPFPAKA